MTIQQDSDFYLSLLEPDDRVAHVLRPGRRAWLHVARGAVSANGCALAAGDGAAIHSESAIEIVCVRSSELLLIDLA